MQSGLLTRCAGFEGNKEKMMNAQTRETTAAKMYVVVKCPTASMPTSRAYPGFMTNNATGARNGLLSEYIATFRRHGLSIQSMRDLMQLRYSWF
jgi:hypothetical protein